ncbi:MAG: hypothetical protein M3281_00960 [Chloroflexota bacterium]|nr:hypothetical protein [Chloroflexota bacterium]
MRHSRLALAPLRTASTHAFGVGGLYLLVLSGVVMVFALSGARNALANADQVVIALLLASGFLCLPSSGY